MTSSPRLHDRRTFARERGVVLVISLIILVALSLAGLALVRSTDTTNVISGNMAFRAAAVQAVDVGVEDAFTAITGVTGYAVAPETGVANKYYTQIQDTTGPDGAPDGLPDVTWSSVAGATPTEGNTIRWVAERMCNGLTTTRELILANCSTAPGAPNSSQKPGLAPTNQNFAVAYRVTVRVEGPRNTVAMAQAIIAR
jgi:type IV pilus assembly protein PilX